MPLVHLLIHINMAIITDLKKIHQILHYRTVEVIVKTDLEKKLLSGKKLTIKLGIDPTGSDLHLGHMVVVRKLKEFQDLGHQIVLLFGNFTGQIGDPTDKKETRKPKTQQELEKNAEHYVEQVSRILDVKKTQIAWNADWLAKLTFADVVQLASNFTVAQMLERDMFQERMKVAAPISLHEFFYPLMQGYDSVALKADVELGATEQTFNLLAGRVLQKAYGQEPQNVLTVPILVGLDGKMKMGKSTGNYVGVNEDAQTMYGKIMSIPDHLILQYFELATDIDSTELDKVKEALAKGENPRDLKMQLARTIVELYHSKEAARIAEEQFIQIFSKKELPDEIPLHVLNRESLPLIELLTNCELATSKAEARRLIEQGGVKVDQEKVMNFQEPISLQKERLIQVGKRKFLRVISH